MIEVFVDGAPTRTSMVFLYPNGKKMPKILSICQSTNNEAEFKAVINALLYLQEEDYTGEVTVFTDSNNVVNWLNGSFRLKAPNLISLKRDVQDIATGFLSVQYKFLSPNPAGRMLET